MLFKSLFATLCTNIRACVFSMFMCVIVFSRWVALVTEWQSPGVDGETATKSLFWAPTYSSPVPPIPVLPLLSLHANKTVFGIYWLQTKDGPDHSALWADTCILWGIAAEHFRREVFLTNGENGKKILNNIVDFLPLFDPNSPIVQQLHSLYFWLQWTEAKGILQIGPSSSIAVGWVAVGALGQVVAQLED